MMSKIRLSLSILIGCLIVVAAGPSMAADDGWTDVTGAVVYDGAPVCAMILANGQYAFTCSGDGSFDFSCPLDSNGHVTVQVFCNGLTPYHRTVTAAEAAGLSISMEKSDDDRALTIDATVRAKNTSRCVIEGTATRDGQPVCAMILANGRYAFTCSGDGSFRLDLPLDSNGGATLYGFCRGLPPYKYVYVSDDIGFDDDADQDGYTISQGDCDDLDAGRYPGAEEICGDGIDQDCDGADLTCGASFSPTTHRDSAGNPMVLNWYYRIANGSMQIDVEGMPMTFGFSDLHLSIDPQTLARRGSFNGSVSGAASGSFTADFTENLATVGDNTLINAQEMEIDLRLSAMGQSVAIGIDVDTVWHAPVEWFLDRNDLDQLPVGYTYSEAGTVSGRAAVQVTISGAIHDSTSSNVPITSIETWRIAGHRNSMTVNGRTYADIVEVVRSTTIPQYTGGTVIEADVDIRYWVARGIGMIKSIGHFSFLGEPLTLELTGTNLTQ